MREITLEPDNNGYAQRLLAARGRRAAATILTYMEKAGGIKSRLNDGEWEKLRQIVLSAMVDFQDLAIDMVKADSGAINDFWLDALEDIHSELRGLRAERQKSSVSG